MCVCVCVLPMVVMTVPAKKKAELKSHRLLWLVNVPAGFTPERIADTTCWGIKQEERFGGSGCGYKRNQPQKRFYSQ